MPGRHRQLKTKRWEKLTSPVNRHRINSPWFVAVSGLGATALSLLSAPLIARGLGPDGRGYSAAVLAAVAIVPIAFGLGMPIASRFLASSMADHRPLVRTIRLWSVLVTPACVVVAAILVHTLFQELHTLDRWQIAVALSATPLFMLWVAERDIAIAQERYATVGIITLTQPTVYVATIAAAYLQGTLTVGAVAVGSTAGAMAAAAVSGLSMDTSARGPRSALRPLLKRSLSFFGSQFSDTLSSRLDQVIALPLIGAEQAGYYAIAVTLITAPNAIAVAIGTSAFNTLAKNLDRVTQRRVIFRSSVQGLGAGAVCALLIAVTSPFVVPLIFGGSFGPAVLVVIAAVPGTLFMMSSTVSSLMLSAQGRGWTMSSTQLGGLALKILSLFALQHYSAIGASIAASLGFALSAALGFLFLLLQPRIGQPKSNTSN